MAGKSKAKKLQINLTDKGLYILITFFSLVLIGVFVYAQIPNPGHSMAEIGEPSGCSSDQFLQWTGSAWTCTDTAGGLWTQSGSDIYYNSGKVSIGTSAATWPLHVEGTAYIDDFLGIGVMDPAYRLHVSGTVRADSVKATQFVGGGEGLTDLRVLVTPSSDTCDGTTQGLLRYRSGVCKTGSRSSYFEVCMRDDAAYRWNLIKEYNWPDGTCGGGGGGDGCDIGEDYYECNGWYAQPGCYQEEPENCFEMPAL